MLNTDVISGQVEETFCSFSRNWLCDLHRSVWSVVKGAARRFTCCPDAHPERSGGSCIQKWSRACSTSYVNDVFCGAWRYSPSLSLSSELYCYFFFLRTWIQHSPNPVLFPYVTLYHVQPFDGSLDKSPFCMKTCDWSWYWREAALFGFTIWGLWNNWPQDKTSAGNWICRHLRQCEKQDRQKERERKEADETVDHRPA